MTTSGSKVAKSEINSRAVPRLEPRRTISTFSCDIAYSESPTASRALPRCRKARQREDLSVAELAHASHLARCSTSTAGLAAESMRRRARHVTNPESVVHVGTHDLPVVEGRSRTAVIPPWRVPTSLARIIPPRGTSALDLRIFESIERDQTSTPSAERLQARPASSTFSCDIARPVSRSFRSRRERLARKGRGLRVPRHA